MSDIWGPKLGHSSTNLACIIDQKYLHHQEGNKKKKGHENISFSLNMIHNAQGDAVCSSTGVHSRFTNKHLYQVR